MNVRKPDVCYLTSFHIDVNECETKVPCHVNATCTNVDGSFYCACKANYSGDGFFCEGKCFLHTRTVQLFSSSEAFLFSSLLTLPPAVSSVKITR